jgi:two-component system, OmpR family, KDP operon response regulator KdpE
MTMSVLLVCDDRALRRQLANVLRHGHFESKVANDLADGARRLRRQNLTAVIVTDLTSADLPAVVHDLRVLTNLPILVVSRNADEWQKVSVLDAGADDCLTQPYGIEELLAHLRAMLRRFERASDETPVVTDDFTVYVHDRRFVRADGSEAPLTSTEWKVLEVLLRHPGRLVSRAEVLQTVWGADAVDKTQYLRVHMVSIRRKVEPDPACPRYFVTVPGLGLRFVPSAVEAQGSAS